MRELAAHTPMYKARLHMGPKVIVGKKREKGGLI